MHTECNFKICLFVGGGGGGGSGGNVFIKYTHHPNEYKIGGRNKMQTLNDVLDKNLGYQY